MSITGRRSAWRLLASVLGVQAQRRAHLSCRVEQSSHALEQADGQVGRAQLLPHEHRQQRRHHHCGCAPQEPCKRWRPLTSGAFASPATGLYTWLLLVFHEAEERVCGAHMQSHEGRGEAGLTHARQSKRFIPPHGPARRVAIGPLVDVERCGDGIHLRDPPATSPPSSLPPREGSVRLPPYALRGNGGGPRPAATAARYAHAAPRTAAAARLSAQPQPSSRVRHRSCVSRTPRIHAHVSKPLFHNTMSTTHIAARSERVPALSSLALNLAAAGTRRATGCAHSAASRQCGVPQAQLVPQRPLRGRTLTLTRASQRLA
jgi:hypothetical protein